MTDRQGMEQRAGIIVLLSSLVAYLWTSSLVLPVGVSLSVVLAALAMCLAGVRLLRERSLSALSSASVFLAVCLVTVCWMTFVHLSTGTLGEGGRRVLQVAFGGGIALASTVLVTRPAPLRWALAVFVVAACVSAAVGIGQHTVGGPFVELWKASGGLASVGLPGRRVAGLAPTVVSFSYQLSAVLPVAVALACAPARWGWRVLWFGTAVVVGAALVLTGVRSAVGGAFAGAVLALLLVVLRSARWRAAVAGAALASVALYAAVGALLDTSRFLGLDDVSAAVRLPMFSAAISHAARNPWGTGTYEPAEEYLDPELGQALRERVLRHDTHNQFLNVLVFFGFPGLMLVLAAYTVVLVRLRGSWRRVVVPWRAKLAPAAAGLAGGLLGYLINSLFHNAGLFVGDVFHWYAIGLVFALHRMVATVQDNADTELPTNG